MRGGTLTLPGGGATVGAMAGLKAPAPVKVSAMK